MDRLTEDFSRPEEMTILAQEEISDKNTDENMDEMDNLQQSFHEVVHNENIQPKMQCLMMDSSFSMVTMQGEDSGIEWETTPSRCATPWLSDAKGNFSADLSSTGVSPAPSGSSTAGKIIFVMDEELISQQRKTKELGKGAKGKGNTQKGIFLGSFDNISGRPELVGFSEPNVKQESEGVEEQVANLSEDKEQKLFRLVSEGSEILNIIVPLKVATVDEEESKEMVDNLSYLEASTVVKAHKETDEQISSLQNAGLQASVVPIGVPMMDPPGAPVSKPVIKEQPNNADYFEAFSLIDAQAPGGPAVSEQEQNNTEKAVRALDVESLGCAKNTCNNTTSSLEEDNADKTSLGEITSELLDDVFYGNAELCGTTAVRADDNKHIPPRLSLKSTGSTLFGSQEDVLTPIYLPEGPPKIIDPILLEEPKAMAFLYTDLYEEATGSRKKEEDTESLSSEKSFHSRHSDREARGYLEKYVLIDETPILEVEQNEKVHCPKDSPRIITQDLYEFVNMVSKPDINPLPETEEVTDFFRSSANSSPCDLESLSRLAEDDEAQTEKKDKVAKTKKQVLIVAEKVSQCTTDSSTDFTLNDLDWESAFDDPLSLNDKDGFVPQQPFKEYTDLQLPVAPPRKKASSLQKSCLDLAPLTPVIIQEEMETTAKENREEEKETADGGDVEEISVSLSEATLPQDIMPSDDTIFEANGQNTAAAEEIESLSMDEGSPTLSDKSVTLEVMLEPQEAEPTNNEAFHNQAKGHCIIL